MEFDKKSGIIILILFIFFGFYKPVVCFLIVGSLILYHGIHYLEFLNSITKNGIESLGKIVSHESDEGYKIPIIEFKTLEEKLITGKPYYYASTDASFFRSYKNDINKNIKILYSSKNPERFVVKAEKSFNYGTLIFSVIIGAAFTSMAIAQLLGYVNVIHK
ncbi:DUF3592 domain-containing protein [Flavobacterium reichenbachii]|uniref:DUF3592 domain-containing protein n=1 Tax=Flavobacterium reichenbachii TaxID=362418 RepID=A0A085ZNV9_9FLAO|nr:DUF3592 domain-containing protein [Flavobacterium reichenbachii]KFF06123.1 hypothetical protein IW19_11545 [Flavobacterium reichenbachii]OXB14654.1 hypothetical protein B0A68_11405 [Flavobacterium reichenbachii]